MSSGGEVRAQASRSGEADATDATDATDDHTAGRVGSAEDAGFDVRSAATAIVWVNLAVVLLYRGNFGHILSSPVINNWATVFVSLTLQALPFLVMGVIVSAAISSLVPSTWLVRAIPKRTALAIPAAGVAGALLPGCECSSVPVAGRLVSRGVSPAAALTFLLSAPAINPVVVVATAVAFTGRPEMVVARFVASLLTAVIVGTIWSRFADADWMEQRLRQLVDRSHAHDFVETATSDFLQAGGFLVLGAALVATLQTVVPQSAVDTLGGDGIVAILALAVLAVVLSICSEADAFVAVGLTQFSMTSRLVFLVVGPMVDLKLIALQIGTFGRRFSLHFAPLTFVTAVVVGTIVGEVLL